MVASFGTRELAMERIKEVQPRFSIQPDRVYDPEDPNADAEGYIWVISDDTTLIGTVEGTMPYLWRLAITL
jgi:flagellar basal body rod protein FlgC